MRKVFVILFSAAFSLYSCTTQSGGESATDETLREAKGGKYYGKLFKVNESDYFKNLFPHSISDAISYRIATQVYEGLLKFDPQNLKLVPGLAESYTTDTSRTVFTFKLRKGVMFQDNECFPGGKGREVTAEDVKYCFTLLCTDHLANQGFSATFKGVLKGADEYFAASAGDKKPSFEVNGIKVLDKYTIQLTLLQPSSIFEYNLAKPYGFIFPKEAYEKYGVDDMRTKAVGTGPFMIDKIDEWNSVILKRNPNYYLKDEDGNQLPYLSGIKIRFMKDKKQELLEFKKGNFDMMYRMPTDHIIEIEEDQAKKKGQYGKYDLQRTPELATHFLLFLNTGKIFNDKNVRKAFSFAIDRKYILEAILNGEGYDAAIYGITPPSFGDKYDIRNIRGYNRNGDSARYYLNKAGYKDGKNFPKVKLQLNSDGERNEAVAVEVQKQLKEVLGIEIEIDVVPLAQLVDNMQSGKADFARGGWMADYPNPENFLWFFYGKNVPTDPSKISYPNMMRYINPEFDKHYELGLHAKTQEEAFKNFMIAENIMIQDAPIIVLWYDEGYRLVQPNVKNFYNNAMQYRDFTKVYFVPETTAANNNTAQKK